jgi:hypothetical protein
MAKMKEVVDKIEDLLENGYDDEGIALIVGVDISVVNQVKKNLGIEPVEDREIY